jgi:hypothetical protein
VAGARRAGRELDDGARPLKPPRLPIDEFEGGDQGRENTPDLSAGLLFDHPRSSTRFPVNVKRRMSHASVSLWTRCRVVVP